MTSPSPRIAVFVSSTLGECKSERDAACAAISSLNYEPVLFEQIGARPYPARATYLEGLYRAQICVIIWRDNYGFIDVASGMDISGVEDEYRQAGSLGKEVFLYVNKDHSKRDPRLSALIEDAKLKYTLYFYDDVMQLQDQIRDDITSRVSQVFTQRFSPASGRLTDPAAVLSGILPLSQPAIVRPALEAALDTASADSQMSWLLGPAGSGKTVLLAQWAIKRAVPYVNGRGLAPLQLMGRIISTLSGKDSTIQPANSLDQAMSLLRELWSKNTSWPLVVDDPPDPRDLAEKLRELNAEYASARVIIATRDSQFAADPAVTIPPLTIEEVSKITASLPPQAKAFFEAEGETVKDIFPLALRRASASTVATPGQVFEDVGASHLDAKERELLAFVVASPEPLSLEDILWLSSADSSVEVDERLAKIHPLVIDDGLGYRPVHDELAEELKKALAKRAGLQKFICLRLAQRFERTSRHSAAFDLYEPFDHEKALVSAHKAAAQFAVEGAIAQSVTVLEFIAADSRTDGDRFGLAFNLVALAQAYEVAGNTSDAGKALAEAEKTAESTADEPLLQLVRDQILIHRIRHDLRPEDLETLRTMRNRYRSENRLAEAGRLAVEEGAILINVNDYENAIPVLREARQILDEVSDSYGQYIATRNLIAALSISPDGQSEADQLMNELNHERGGMGRLRERAWICNILARRYRTDGLIDDSIAAATEAMELGEKLGDQNLVSLNRIGLGNALREKPDLEGALEAFKTCSREAHALNRKDTEALACRLAADVLVQMAHEATPYLRPKLFSDAENFATYATGLLRDSIARVHWAEALDTRGDALSGLGRQSEANQDYAQAARLFGEFSPDRSVSIIRNLALNIDDNKPIESFALLSSAVAASQSEIDKGPFPALINFIGLAASSAPRQAVGYMFAAAARLARPAISEGQEFGLWLRFLSLALRDINVPDDGRGAFIFLALIAQLRKREFSVTQLNAVADLILSKSKGLTFRATPDGHLQISFKLGLDGKLLVTITDIDTTPATRFVGLAIASFIVGYREEINRDFLSSPIKDATHVHVSLLDADQAPADMKEMVDDASEASSVGVMAFKGKAGERSLYVICSRNAQQRCKGDPLQATELQFMYADILRALLYTTLGEIEEDVLRPKIVSLLRSTIQ